MLNAAGAREALNTNQPGTRLDVQVCPVGRSFCSQSAASNLLTTPCPGNLGRPLSEQDASRGRREGFGDGSVNPGRRCLSRQASRYRQQPRLLMRQQGREGEREALQGAAGVPRITGRPLTHELATSSNATWLRRPFGWADSYEKSISRSLSGRSGHVVIDEPRREASC